MKHLTPAGKDAAEHAKKAEAAQLRLYLEARGGSIALVAVDLGVHRDMLRKHLAELELIEWLNAAYPPNTGARHVPGRGAVPAEWTTKRIERLRKAIVRESGVIMRAAARLGMPESTLTYQVRTSGLGPWLAATYPVRIDKSRGSAAAVDSGSSPLDDTPERRMLRL